MSTCVLPPLVSPVLIFCCSEPAKPKRGHGGYTTATATGAGGFGGYDPYRAAPSPTGGYSGGGASSSRGAGGGQRGEGGKGVFGWLFGGRGGAKDVALPLYMGGGGKDKKFSV